MEGLMSFDALSQERLDSLEGKVVTLLVDGRMTNKTLARGLILNATHRRRFCTVLDIDGLYSSNSDFIFGPLSEEEANTVELLVPEPGSDLRVETAQALSLCRSQVVIVDSLNSLFHLLPARGRGWRSRNLAFVLAFFSYLARTGGKTVIITKYRRAVEGKVPVTDRSDYLFSVTLNENIMSLKEEKTTAVPASLPG
jgi:hypothetical protein